MDKFEEILDSSKSLRLAKRNAVYHGLDDYMDTGYFQSNSKDVGFLSWCYFFDINGNSKEIHFDYAMLSKDSTSPRLYCTSHDFVDTDIKRSSDTKFSSMGVKTIPSWAKVLKNSNKNERNQAKNIALNGVLKYNRGKVTKSGKELVSFLENDCQFLGFVPHVAYVMHDSKSKQDLKSVWVHAFAQRTLLYKIVDTPCLLMINSSIELNDSALAKIEGNERVNDLKDIRGITG